MIAQEVYEGEKSNLAVLLSEYESVESELDMLKGNIIKGNIQYYNGD